MPLHLHISGPRDGQLARLGEEQGPKEQLLSGLFLLSCGAKFDSAGWAGRPCNSMLGHEYGSALRVLLDPIGRTGVVAYWRNLGVFA